jgi:hypothetical protein
MAFGSAGQFKQIITCIPSNPGYYTYGEWSQSDTTSIEVWMSVQPASDRDMKTLPEGRYRDDAYVLYSDYGDLVSYAEDRTGDKVILYGEEYEIAHKRPWQNNVINHYKYIAAKLC